MNTLSSASFLQARQRSHATYKRGFSLALSTCLLLGSVMLAYTVLSPSKNAYAASPTEFATQSTPWGVAPDTNGHIFVAEPGCNVPNTPPPYTCLTTFAATISEYNVADGSKVATYSEPSGYSSPFFLAVDGSGNVWFTEFNGDAIGELTPTGLGTWSQIAVTSGANPFDLTFDNNGNLWFSEFATGKIGFLNPTTGVASLVETAIPAGASSNPYGITKASDGSIWFAENALGNNGSSGVIGSFTPTSNGTLTVGAITEHTVTGVPHPHLITTDTLSHVWYSSGFAGVIGRFNTSDSASTTYDVSLNACPGSPQGCGVHISGIAVDSVGRVWFDDSLSDRVGYLDPTTSQFTTIKLTTGSHPHDGLLVGASDNVWFTEEFANNLGEIAGGVLPVTPTPSATATVTATPPPSTTPVNKTWYFAEGRVGKGFQEYLTLGNPDASIDCTVNVKYLYTFDNASTLNTTTVALTVAHQFRVTRSVNNDLHIAATGRTAAIVAAVVTVNTVSTPNCLGVVVERPMYFRTNMNGGSDALGATSLSQTYYFADVQTRSGSSSSINSFFTILNPPANATANVVATYYAGGQVVGTQQVQVPAGARRTLSSNALALPAHVLAVVTSTQPVAVERPVYYRNIAEGNAGVVSSAATVVGAQTVNNDWLFAEGYTGGRFQEYLLLANPTGTTLVATVKLEYKGGHYQHLSYLVGARSQLSVDVNQLNKQPMGACDSNPCHVSPETSLEVTSANNLVAERELFFQYSHTVNGSTLTTAGGTDVIGQPGPANYAAYSFAEGYANRGYNEWLTLQNPTNATENITLTLSNSYGSSYSQNMSIAATSRTTTDITQLVTQHLVHFGDDYRAYEVTMSLASSGNAVFVAERPMYWNTSGSSFVTQGGSDIIGYVGN